MSANDTVGSPTTNTQETITDIIAAKRSEADSIEQSARGSFKVGYSWDDMPFTEVDLERELDNAARIRKEADRLEAALKRELESMSGNAAKLREAIEAVLLAFNYGESTIVNQLPFSKLLPMLRKCIEALAGPSRNCDKFDTKDTAREAFQKLRGHRVLADVSLWDDRDEIEAFLDWLFATKKGGVNAGK